MSDHDLERQYPNWRGRFTSLAEAVAHHTKAQDLVIENLRGQNAELRQIFIDVLENGFEHWIMDRARKLGIGQEPV